MIRTVIAEDHQLVRQGIVALLERADDIEIVGEADDGSEALLLVEELAPDVLVTDVAMPGMGGLELLEKLPAVAPGTSVVVLTMYADPAIAQRAMSLGASGYVLKGSIAEDLRTAIRVASQGGTFVAPTASKHTSSGTPVQQSVELTAREREVLSLIGKGMTNQAVASHLDISVKTVDRHRTSVMRKLEATNVVELIRSAVRLGYIQISE